MTAPRVLAFIMAGGKGERLEPLTRERSRPAARILAGRIGEDPEEDARRYHVDRSGITVVPRGGRLHSVDLD